MGAVVIEWATLASSTNAAVDNALQKRTLRRKLLVFFT
jgi:hypothetical protein